MRFIRPICYLVVLLLILFTFPVAHAQDAVYDGVLGAPKCSGSSSPCIAASALLISRDSMGGTQEPNQPNTLDGCTDGGTGNYGSEESVENITITDLDTSNFAGGDNVRVTVGYHAFESSGVGDYVSVWYTNSTSSITWQFIGTFALSDGSYATHDFDFVLDDVVGEHAVRAQIRYNGADSSCLLGAYDDNDDLVFQVDAGEVIPDTRINITGCTEISSNGSYKLNQILSGANISATPYSDLACLKITTSNVAISCEGYNISNNGTTGTTFGILINGTVDMQYNNITIENCPNISVYTYGVYSSFANVTLSNSTIFNNTYNMYLNASNTSASSYTLYNADLFDLIINNSGGSDQIVNISSMIFDNSAGGLVDYTTISLNDTVSSGSAYSLNWSAIPFTLPTNYNSFENKYLNLSTISGTVSIEQILWHWTNAETIGYTESQLQLYGYSASIWDQLNDSPDTTEHTLGLTDLVPGTVYGILESPTPSGCQLIDAPGIYTLNIDATGAPTDYDIFTASACIVIDSSDVELNCDGHSITGDDTGTYQTKVGIFAGDLASLQNITIRNCPNISSYTVGLYTYSINESSFSNITIYNTTGIVTYGAYLSVFSYSDVSNLTVYNTTGNGIDIYGSNVTFSDTLVYDSDAYGIYVNGFASNHTFSNATVHSSVAGIHTASYLTNISVAHLYNNTVDLELYGGTADVIIYLDNVVFDSASGTYVNYTNLSMSDTLPEDMMYGGERYTITHTTNSSTLPTDYSSFAQKFINITNTSRPVSIDSISWTWLESELTGYTEADFELWKYDASGWTLLNDTPDTTNNIITLSALVPSGEYAILLNDTASDSTYPTISLEYPENTTYSTNESLPLNYTVADETAIDSCWYSLDDGASVSLAGCTNTTFNVVAGGGWHNITVYVNDSANNTNSTIQYFSIDSTYPTISLEYPENTTYSTNSIALQYLVSDSNLDSCWYNLNGESNTTLAGCGNTTLTLANGGYSLTIYANDSANNTNSSSIHFTVNYSPTVDGQIETSDESSSKPEASLSWENICPDNELEVTIKRGSAISGATIKLILVDPYAGIIDTKLTDGTGKTLFALERSGTYRLIVSHSSYTFDNPYEFDYAMCRECIVDSECDAGFECVEGACSGTLIPDTVECILDSDCLSTETCTNSVCLPVQLGQCGYIANHSWYDYECCTNSQCNDGYKCVGHTCIPLEMENMTVKISFPTVLELNTSLEQILPAGTENITVRIWIDSEICSECVVGILTLNGREFSGITDTDGFISFHFAGDGIYKFILVDTEGGSTRESFLNISVESIPLVNPPTLEDEPKTWITISSYLGLGFILIILIILLIYWKNKKKK
ncbi:MAG: right-handed parallel beta-helix repeat-containing protein [Candidatus Micrarchaeota archaeon]